MRQSLVARDINLAYLGLGFLIYIDGYLDIAGVVLVVELQHLHLSIVETLLRQVLLDHRLGVVGEVGRHLAAVADTYLDLYILPLAFFESVIRHIGHTRALLKRNLQPHLLPLNLFCLNFNIGEKALLPETLNGLRDLIARNLNLVAYSQTGETDQHEVFVTVGSDDLDACYLVGLALVGVFYLRNCFFLREWFGNLGVLCALRRLRFLDYLSSICWYLSRICGGDACTVGG